ATAESLYDAGVIAGKAGQVKDQQVAWGRLRKEFPHHPLAYQAAYDLAETALKKKEWTQAAAQAKAAAASDEETLRARALLLEGESELKLSRFRDAAKSFEAVGSVKNLEAADRYRALAGLGLAREQLGEIRAALAAYDAVATKSPDATLRNWARDRAAARRAQPHRAHFAKGEYDDAVQDLEAAVRRGKERDLLTEARYWLAETYYRLDRFQQADALFRQVARGPRTADFTVWSLHSSGWTALRLNDMSRARDTFSQFQSATPAELEAWARHGLGLANYALGRHDDAVAAWTALAARAPASLARDV